VVERCAHERPHEVLGVVSTLEQGDHFGVEIHPFLFRPRILPLEKGNEELVT